MNICRECETEVLGKHMNAPFYAKQNISHHLQRRNYVREMMSRADATLEG